MINTHNNYTAIQIYRNLELTSSMAQKSKSVKLTSDYAGIPYGL